LACPVVTEPSEVGVIDSAAHAVTGVADSRTRELPLDGLNLLLIDDNPVSLLVAQKQLERVGARVHAHGDARLALNALFAGAPGIFDAVLTDVQMPKLDGIECTRLI
jgi:PleD family two-component response regulator